ncbi:MAG: hypothetical protein A4E19_05005 [Nitrospira sp. SG-bin1]|nr:MAG: hypothetical protein A4E19_05005 [Nitrospira sp. SG-bin1]
MKLQVFPRVSLAMITILLLTACQIQNWKGASVGSFQDAAIERHPELASLPLYIPKYLSEGPLPSERFLLPSPHKIIDALKSKIKTQNGIGIFQVMESAPETGIFSSLRLEELEASGLRKAWAVFSISVQLLIPFYDDSLGYNVTYELFIDAKLKNRYQYSIRGKQLAWFAIALVVPFKSSDWEIMNIEYGSVSDRLLEELLSTSRLFVEDARRDGFLR